MVKSFSVGLLQLTALNSSQVASYKSKDCEIVCSTTSAKDTSVFLGQVRIRTPLIAVIGASLAIRLESPPWADNGGNNGQKILDIT